MKNYSKLSLTKTKAQISLEYIILIGFVTFVLITILGIAFIYSGTIQDRIKGIQISNFANKITSSAESVFYFGEPSKATISTYLPEGVQEISISENTIFISTQTSMGLEKRGFSSEVPITGTLTINPGIKKIELIANSNNVAINSL